MPRVTLKADRGCSAPFTLVIALSPNSPGRLLGIDFLQKILGQASPRFMWLIPWRELLSIGWVNTGAIAQVSPQKLGACLLGKAKGLNNFCAGSSWAEGLWPDESLRPYV